MSRDDIHTMVNTFGGLLNAVRHADPADKAEVYRELGVRLTYDHRTHRTSRNPTNIIRVRGVCVRGGFDHYAHALNQRKLL